MFGLVTESIFHGVSSFSFGNVSFPTEVDIDGSLLRDVLRGLGIDASISAFGLVPKWAAKEFVCLGNGKSA